MPPLLAASVPGAGGGEMADGPLDGHAFDLATAVRGGPDRWEALVDGGWGVGDRPNGGYLLALATRAALPPVAECISGRPELPDGVRVGLLDHVDIRIDPATTGWATGSPSGRLEMRGWVRFRDGRGADPLGLLQMVDALPPASFELGIQAWAPTVELTVYVRGLPAPGWLACVVRGQLWQDGWFDEEAEVWDAGGHLVAQSRQLAGAQIGR